MRLCRRRRSRARTADAPVGGLLDLIVETLIVSGDSRDATGLRRAGRHDDPSP
jgi:hypothetical protein